MEFGHRYFGSFPGSTPSWPSGPVGDGIWTPAHRKYIMGSAAIGSRVWAEDGGGNHQVQIIFKIIKDHKIHDNDALIMKEESTNYYRNVLLAAARKLMSTV